MATIKNYLVLTPADKGVPKHEIKSWQNLYRTDKCHVVSQEDGHDLYHPFEDPQAFVTNFMKRITKLKLTRSPVFLQSSSNKPPSC